MTLNTLSPTFIAPDPPQRRRVALIPAYNEARFIGSVVLQTRHSVDIIVVVDDGSTDGTADLARQAGAVVVEMPQNGGKAKALSVGLAYIATLRPTAVVMLDGDGQHHPHQIPTVLAPIEREEADIVIGSRFLDIKSEIPRWRIWGQHALTLATNVASGVKATDSQSGYRAFAPDILELLRFNSEGGFSVESEMQFLVQEYNLRLVEVPISVVYAEPPKRNPVFHALQVLNRILRLVGQNRPFLSFGVPGFLALLFGILLGVQVIAIYQASLTLAVGYALLSVLLLVLGAIGIATGTILHSVRGLLIEWGQRHFTSRSPEVE
jgi:glycosyltransferase involved in cell wall biosynthesis